MQHLGRFGRREADDLPAACPSNCERLLQQMHTPFVERAPVREVPVPPRREVARERSRPDLREMLRVELPAPDPRAVQPPVDARVDAPDHAARADLLFAPAVVQDVMSLAHELECRRERGPADQILGEVIRARVGVRHCVARVQPERLDAEIHRLRRLRRERPEQLQDRLGSGTGVPEICERALARMRRDLQHAARPDDERARRMVREDVQLERVVADADQLLRDEAAAGPCIRDRARLPDFGERVDPPVERRRPGEECQRDDGKDEQPAHQKRK